MLYKYKIYYIYMYKEKRIQFLSKLIQYYG